MSKLWAWTTFFFIKAQCLTSWKRAIIEVISCQTLSISLFLYKWISYESERQITGNPEFELPGQLSGSTIRPKKTKKILSHILNRPNLLLRHDDQSFKGFVYPSVRPSIFLFSADDYSIWNTRQSDLSGKEKEVLISRFVSICHEYLDEASFFFSFFIDQKIWTRSRCDSWYGDLVWW